jgi:hypothetical protein
MVFHQVFPAAKQLARNTDPISSLLRAIELVESGEHGRQCKEVYAVLKNNDGNTSAEIGKKLNVGEKGRFIAARRLSDLKNMGVVRQGEMRECDVAKNRCVTWWVIRNKGESHD